MTQHKRIMIILTKLFGFIIFNSKLASFNNGKIEKILCYNPNLIFNLFFLNKLVKKGEVYAFLNFQFLMNLSLKNAFLVLKKAALVLKTELSYLCRVWVIQ